MSDFNLPKRLREEAELQMPVDPETARLLEEAADLIDRLSVQLQERDAQLAAIAAIVVKHQPAGSPPPGGLPELVQYVLETQDAQVAECRLALTGKLCQYPECVDNEDGRCTRWLTSECAGPTATTQANAKIIEAAEKQEHLCTANVDFGEIICRSAGDTQYLNACDMTNAAVRAKKDITK